MLFEPSNFWITVLNVLGIPIVHLGISWLSLKLPASWFQGTTMPKTSAERLYEKCFLIRKWKKYLPDAAPWFDGFSKGKLESTDPDYLREFIQETRRGEFSHWLQLIMISLFVVWNPPVAAGIMVFYAWVSNFPCILNQRYVRIRMSRVLHKTDQSS